MLCISWCALGEAGVVRARIHLNHCLQSAMRPTEPMHQVSDYYKDIWYVLLMPLWCLLCSLCSAIFSDLVIYWFYSHHSYVYSVQVNCRLGTKRTYHSSPGFQKYFIFAYLLMMVLHINPRWLEDRFVPKCFKGFTVLLFVVYAIETFCSHILTAEL